MLTNLLPSHYSNHNSALLRSCFLAFALLCAPLSQTATAQSVAPEEGLWINDSGEGAIEIKKCGRSLCGYIVWLKDPMSRNGGPKRDIYNPKPKNRRNLICGLQVLCRLEPVSSGGFDNGWIYDPKKGKAYDAAIRLVSKNQLEVLGYLTLKALGKTFYWTRAKGELPSCAPDQ